MEELDRTIKSHILNKEITSVGVFNVNDSYIELEQDFQWLIDGGIQFDFGDEYICLGWDFENEGFVFSMIKSLDKILGEAPYYKIEPQEVKGVSGFSGSRIKDVQIKWEFYYELDDEGEPKSEKIYTPVELLLEFDSERFLQLALINFEFDQKAFKIARAEYNIFGRLLLSVDQKLEISE